MIILSLPDEEVIILPDVVSTSQDASLNFVANELRASNLLVVSCKLHSHKIRRQMKLIASLSVLTANPFGRNRRTEKGNNSLRIAHASLMYVQRKWVWWPRRSY